MSTNRRSRNLAAVLMVLIVLLIVGYYIAMRRAERQAAEAAYRSSLEAEGMTEQQRREFIEYMNREIDSTR